MDLNKLYSEDDEFREYVERCAYTRHISVDIVLTLQMTKNYAEYLIYSRKDSVNECENNSISSKQH